MRSHAMRAAPGCCSRVLNDSDDENLFMIASEERCRRRRGLLRLARVPDFQGCSDPDARRPVHHPRRCPRARHACLRVVKKCRVLSISSAWPSDSQLQHPAAQRARLEPSQLEGAATFTRHRVVSSTVRIWRFDFDESDSRRRRSRLRRRHPGVSSASVAPGDR